MELTPQYLTRIRGNKRIRQRLTYEDPLWFALLYLGDHFTRPLAPFHAEMFHMVRSPHHMFVATMAFRESGKSTILNMTNALWSILGKPGKRFVVIIGKTQEQAKSHFASIKSELQHNELLKHDFGPFIESEDKWNKLSLELEYHGSKILCVTRDQSLRGIKYGQFRPDLIICDDLEDTLSYQRPEQDALYSWFGSEILPLGSANTRIVVLGNLLFEHSFLMRLREDIRENKIPGVFRAYPLLDDNGLCLWESKFPDAAAILKLRAQLSQEVWAREYLLALGDPIHYYDDPVAPDDETRERVVCREYGKKLAVLGSRYRSELGIGTVQAPLIAQMSRYVITAPEGNMIVEREPNDPKYEKYQEYRNESAKLGDALNDALWQVIVERIRERARREGELI